MELLLVASEQLGGKAIGNVGRADGPLDVPEPGERTRCDGQPELVGNAARHPEAGIEAGVVELTLELGHAGAEGVELAASSKHAAIVCSGVGAPDHGGSPSRSSYRSRRGQIAVVPRSSTRPLSRPKD